MERIRMTNRYSSFDDIPKNHYRSIVVDPPWRYQNKNTGGSMVSGSKSKYHTMSIDELSRLPVKSIADKDSILFLWSTTPLLPLAFDLMKTWGYTYKTSIYWNKLNYGMGFWYRGQIEQCLVGIRGKVPAFRSKERNFFEEKVVRHSQKPEYFWELVEPCLDSKYLSPRIELFARSTRPGWDAFGNEIMED